METTKPVVPDIRIVILQRGWVFVGRYTRNGEDCALTGAHCIRRWGTTRGLGQLASEGPQPNTTLEAAPEVGFHVLTVIATIRCDAAKWGMIS